MLFVSFQFAFILLLAGFFNTNLGVRTSTLGWMLCERSTFAQGSEFSQVALQLFQARSCCEAAALSSACGSPIAMPCTTLPFVTG
jgi:hypothetical protein